MASISDTSEILLQASNIRKSFPGVLALDGASITVRRGKLTALLGENGAGKSTLMNILMGVLEPDSGEILLDGRPIRFRGTRDAQASGIAMIFQELNLVSELSLAQNIFLGREPRTPLGLVDDRRMNREAQTLLTRLRLNVDPRTKVGELPVGAQQLVEIAKALSLHARIIIMDEPTSAITEQEIAVLFDILRELKAQGTGIIYITHKLDELPRIADDIVVLRDGKFIHAAPLSDVTRQEMIRLMVGRDLAELFPKSASRAGEVVLAAQDISLRHPERPGEFLVRNVSFDLKKGEVLGIFGLMGAGRTELLQTLFGLHPHLSSGQLLVSGKSVPLRDPSAAIAAGLALAPEDRKREGLVLPLSVAENTTLASLQQTEKFGLLNVARERKLVNSFVERLRVKTPSIWQLVRNLSGGNQQKIVLAKWLATKPKVLMLDEPTRGIDINAKREIYALIDELTQAGLGVILVSSELPEVLGVADRILVLSQGRLAAEFARADATEENVLAAALPVSSAPVHANPGSAA
jgi:ribose transport system ATP-binding protein